MKDRIKQFRKEKGMTQPEFGASLGVSRDVIANIEGGRVEPNSLFVQHLCQIYGVNEIWLRTGEGEMTAPVTEDEQIAAYVADVLGDAPDTFRRRLLAAQASWTPEMWDALKQICDSLK